MLLSDIARLRGRIEVNIGSATDAHRIFIDAAHAVHDVDPLRALEMAVAAAIMRTYGADSGATLQPGDILVEPSAGDTPRTRCLKQMLVAMTLAPRSDWAGAVAALDSALASGEDVDDLDVLGNLGNAALQLGDDEAQQRFYALALSRAREPRRRHGGGLRPAAAVLRPPRRRRPGRGAQPCRGGARARRRASVSAR